MNKGNKNLVSMYLTLTIGSAVVLLLGNIAGLTNIQLNRSLVISLVGVTTTLYAGMFVPYRIAAKHTN